MWYIGRETDLAVGQLFLSRYFTSYIFFTFYKNVFKKIQSLIKSAAVCWPFLIYLKLVINTYDKFQKNETNSERVVTEVKT